MRAVVFEQRFVVPVDQEGSFSRVNQRRLNIRSRQRLPARRPHPVRLPTGERQPVGHLALRATALGAHTDFVSNRGDPTSRQSYFTSPRRVLRPAMLPEIVCNRGEDVLLGPPDVAVTVAIEILGPFEITRWHELRLPHRAGPRPTQFVEADVAAIDDPE